MDAEREIRGLERNEITGFSNWTWRNPFCQIRKNARLQHFEGLEEGKITWCSNRISSTCRWISGLERCEVAGFSNVKMSRSVVRKQNCMVLKRNFFRVSSPLVWEAEEITKFSNQDCSRGGTYPGLKENKITWCSNYNRNCDRNVLGLEENKTTGFSSIMPFSYPRLIVLEAEEIAWRSNKLGIVSQWKKEIA